MKSNYFKVNRTFSKWQLFLLVNVSFILSISIIFRLVDLANIPGINSDEAWYGVQMFQMSSGNLSSWKTPTGNLINPFFSGIIFLLQSFFPPAFNLLRLPAAISNILAIVLTYYLFSKVLGKNTAIIATLLVASLPINIGYSRFGWDQSQAVLVSVIVIYFALKQNWLGLSLAIAAALIIHPTNIFLIPFVLAPLIARFIIKFPLKNLLHLLAKKRVYLLLSMSGFLLIFALAITLPKTQSLLGNITIERLLRFTQTFSLFFIYYGQLLSGVTIYRYIVGPDSSFIWLLHDIIFWSLFLVVAILGTRKLVKTRQGNFLALVLGLVGTLVIFYFVAHLKSITPDYSRYAICLIMPSIVVFAILINSISQAYQKPWLSIGVTIVICWLLLGSFQTNYFNAIKTTGGLSALAFRTASIEPKQQAFSIIRENAKADKSVIIIAEDWWLYWPLRYLAISDQRISIDNVVSRKNRLPRLTPAEFYARINQGAYAVGFAGGAVEQLINQMLPNNSLKQWNITDYSGQRVLSVWQKQKTQDSDQKK